MSPPCWHVTSLCPNAHGYTRVQQAVFIIQHLYLTSKETNTPIHILTEILYAYPYLFLFTRYYKLPGQDSLVYRVASVHIFCPVNVKKDGLLANRRIQERLTKTRSYNVVTYSG